MYDDDDRDNNEEDKEKLQLLVSACLRQQLTHWEMEMEMEMDEGSGLGWMIVRPEKGGFRDLLRYAVTGDIHSFSRFVDYGGDEDQTSSSTPTHTPDHRWIILVSILVRKIIAFFAKPMEWTGRFLDFLLNLLSLNGNFVGLLRNFIHGICISAHALHYSSSFSYFTSFHDDGTGNVVVPVRDTETFISTIGQLDGRLDLHEFASEGEEGFKPEIGNRALMDLCIMSSKLAYENAQVIKCVVNRHWKATSFNSFQFYE